MALKALLITLFLVLEILVFFWIVIWIQKLLKKTKSSLTEVGILLVALILSILFIGIFTSFILYVI